MASKKTKRAKVSKPAPAASQKQHTLEDLVRIGVDVQKNLRADGIGIRFYLESGPLRMPAPDTNPSAAPKARFTKIGAKGDRLVDSATEWEGVFDATTGLVWGRKLLPGSHTWKEAIEVASEASLCGGSARAPTIQERQSIIDYSRHSPALDTNYFAKESGWEWTSTPDAESPSDYAWYVYLASGGCYRFCQGVRAYVRAVLAGQQLNLL